MKVVELEDGNKDNWSRCKFHVVKFYNVTTQENTNPWVKLLLQEFQDVFVEELKTLPPSQPVEHKIELLGSMPKPALIYCLTLLEDQTLKAYVLDALEKGLI